MMNLIVEKIISGGQTGADRAALDFAIEHGLPHGGWCPKGRRAEDATIPSQYQLKETPSKNYSHRTEWNVRDSDGTVIFTIKATLTGGSRKTAEFAENHCKPCLHLSAETSLLMHGGLARRRPCWWRTWVRTTLTIREDRGGSFRLCSD